MSIFKFGIFIWSPFILEGIKESQGKLGSRKRSSYSSSIFAQSSGCRGEKGRRLGKENKPTSANQYKVPLLGWAVKWIFDVPGSWSWLWQLARICAITSKALLEGTVELWKADWISLRSELHSHHGMVQPIHVQYHLFKQKAHICTFFLQR